MRLRELHTFLFGTLRGRLILGVALVHAVMMTLFIIDLTVRQRALLLEHQEADATAMARSLATSAATWLAASDLAGLQELVETQGRYPELSFAILADESGRILAHSDRSRRGQFLLDLPKEIRQVVLGSSLTLVDVAIPAILAGRQVGWARVGLGQKAAGRKLTQLAVNGALYALAAIVIGALIAWRMGRRLTARLYVVQETISKVKGGERQARSDLSGTDEAAALAGEFNALLDTLAKHEDELLAGERDFRSLIENSPLAIAVTRNENNATELLNDQFALLFGYTRDDLPELSRWWPLAYPDPAYREEVRADWNAKVEQAVKTGSAMKPMEATVVCKDGSHRRIEFHMSPVGARTLTTFIDLTARQRAEDDVRRSAREWSAAMDAMDDVIYLLSPDRLVLRANQAFYRLTGTTPATAVGKHIVEIVHPDGEELPCPVCRAQEDKRDAILVLEADHPHNPAGRPLEISLRIVRDERGTVVSMLITLHDLTQERAVQSELTKHREHLEELVKERTNEIIAKNAELEKLNKMFVGRELRMVELKERIRELEAQQTENPGERA